MSGAVAATVIFAVDVQVPPGSALGMLYVGVILIGLWSRWQAYPFVAATGVGVLAMVGLAIGWSDARPWAVLVNRLAMLAVYVMTAWMVRRFGAMERELLESVERLADVKRALDSAAIVAITDVTGRITYVNDKFCEISGYSRQELIGQDHRIINSRHHAPEFIRDLWRTITQGQVWHGEIRNRAKDGHFYWVDTTIVPFLDERGKPYQYVAIRADVTARKEAEDQLTHQASLARVGQMAAVLAHEVRNPLAGIRGAMQILMGRREAGDPERGVMEEIVERTASLDALINDLLMFARPRPPRLSEVDLRAVAQEAVAALQHDPAAHNVVMCVDGGPLRVHADAELLRATLVNLLLNAAQAMGGAGTVTVEIGERGDTAEVRVRDNGPGIPEDIREQVLEPFFTTKTRGGGLGLPIAQRAAELHGGRLALMCPSEGGTVVTLTLPVPGRVQPAG
jgi:PAS domain S-box-containing protein